MQDIMQPNVFKQIASYLKGNPILKKKIKKMVTIKVRVKCCLNSFTQSYFTHWLAAPHSSTIIQSLYLAYTFTEIKKSALNQGISQNQHLLRAFLPVMGYVFHMVYRIFYNVETR